MKKFLTRFIAIALVAILFTAPSTAQAASSPVLANWGDNFRTYSLMPDPLILDPNTTMTLDDFASSDLYWHVSSGKSFTFDLGIGDDNYGSFLFTIERVGTVSSHNTIVTVGPAGFTYTIPPIPVDAKYKITIKTLDTLTLWFFGGIGIN